MYSTCLFCHADLGANAVIESFPVGRRLAYDAANGRLWVVCRKCERWNLTPLEERWEAIDQCERLFSSTRMRASTDNIGLAKLREGLELVRIGSPQRPEMASWRYGDQFGRRRRRYVGMSAGAAVIAAGAIGVGPMMGVSLAGVGWGLFQGANALVKVISDRIVRTRVAIPGYDRPTIIRGSDVKRIVIGVDDEGLKLRLPYNRAPLPSEGPAAAQRSEVTLRGDDAMRALGSVLPVVNVNGGKKHEIKIAVDYLEAVPDPVALIKQSASLYVKVEAELAKDKRFARRRSQHPINDTESFLDRISSAVLLAMEMAAHEDVERRAMQGELAILEAAWRQAEEIAAIADNLTVPASVDDEFEKLRAGKG